MKKTLQNVSRAGLPVRTQMQAGNAASDKCYADRNWTNLWAPATGVWYSEDRLKKCLSISGEPLWWKGFQPMTQEEACDLTRQIVAYWDLPADITTSMGC